MEEVRAEGLDMEAVAGLLAATEGGENTEASSRLVIHVYSKLAKLHKHGVIPYLPRIMASVVASLSCSPQLHTACTQVVASLASHTIDPARDPASNEDALRSLCRPLLSAVSSPQPPLLATGAAACLQVLVESDRWRCAPLDLQELICVKGIQALTKEGMRTVAHMCLMRSLAEFSSSVVIQGYGARLLSAGMEILQSSSGMAESWQKRVAAAELLESVLKIADAELLDLDLSPIVGVLQDCQLDRVAGVRTAVAGALRTASLFALDATSHNTNPVAALHPSADKHIAQQSVLGLQQVQSDMGPPTLSTPCHGTVFGSTPSSHHKSAKWPKRSPLLPLQQSPVANPTLVTSRSRRPGALKPSDYKENVPPANYSELQGSSRHSLRDVRMSKKHSPMFRATSNTHCENLSLFNSPQMPIFSFSGEGDSAVPSLCEKRSGKVNGGIEDQFCLSTLGRGTVKNNYRMSGQKFTSLNNMIGCTSDETHRCVEEHYRDGESCNIFGESQDGSRSIKSTEVNLGNGLESPPDEECANDCNSIVSSEHEPNFQVAKNQSYAEDLLITPKGLMCCSLQFDDMHLSDLEQENSMNSNVEMSSETGWGMCEDPDTGESEADGYDEYSTIDTASQESNVTSSSPCSFLEKSDLYSERDTQGNKRSEGKIRWRGVIGDHSDMQVAGLLSPMLSVSSKYSSYSFSDKDKTMEEYHNHVVDGKVDGDRKKLPVFVNDQIKPLNSELKSTEKTLCSAFLKLLRRARSFIGTTFAIVILCAAAIWVTRYLGDLQELNVLVPT